MAEPGGGVDETVREIVAASGSSVVSVDSPDDIALAVAEALDGELVEVDELVDAVARRLAALDERTTALAALELHARLGGDGRRHVVTDLGSLRLLVERIDRAHRFVAESREVLRERVTASSELAVHPETIRKAAAEVTEAKAARNAIEVGIEELESAVPHPDERSAVPAQHVSGWDRDERREVVRAGVVFGVALVVGAVALVITGSVVPLVLPLIALAWGGHLLWQHRQDVVGRDVAADNLAAVSALTDQAYGGAALHEPEELASARRELSAAAERLRYAESAWAALVGPDVDVADLDEVLAGRDAQFHVGDDELARTPTLRAAESHARRLRAQWKLAWWALDRPVPATDHAGRALDELATDGVELVTVDSWEARSPERTDAEAELERIAAGRSVDELRQAAGESPPALVVLDEDGAISEADLEARTAVLPDDVRVVVVRPSG